MPVDNTKNVVVTEAMLAQIATVAGVELRAEDIVVFSATAANTRPIVKRGTLHNGGVITRASLVKMAEMLNGASQAVPIHWNHNTDTVPLGKVFQGDVGNTSDGHSELRVNFYLPKTEADMIQKINNGVVDEVSVGMMHEHILCSACGYDYIGPEADYTAIYDRTCPEGHILGLDGVHAVLDGVDYWSELSLVSRGAITNAKIHSKQKATTPVQERLVASGVPLGATFLSFEPQEAPQKEEIKMPIDPETQAALEGLTSQITALTASVAALVPKEPDALEVALAASAELQTQLDAKAAEAEDLKTQLATAKAPIVVELPVGGLSASAITDATQLTALKATSAFKSPK